MKTKNRSILALLLTLCMLFGLAEPAFAADTAATMQLSKTQGTVTVCNASAKKLTILDNMRLYNGYTVETGAASYAWINLDSAKLVKLDASSKVEIRKSGKKLEALLISGALLADVSEKLTADESLNIRTSTAIVGIRGTIVQVGYQPSAEEEETPAARAFRPQKKHKQINMKGKGIVDVETVECDDVVTVSTQNKTDVVTIKNNVPKLTVQSPAQTILDAIKSFTNNGSSNITVTGTPNHNVGGTIISGGGAVTLTAGQGLSISTSVKLNKANISNVQQSDLSGSTQTHLVETGNTTVPSGDSGSFVITEEAAQQRLLLDQRQAENAAAATNVPDGVLAAIAATSANKTNTDNVWGNTSDSAGSSSGSSSSGGSSGGSSSGSSSSNRPGSDNPGTDVPGTDVPGTDVPGTDVPGTDEPGTDEPGTDEPGTEDPGTDEPTPPAQYSVTFNSNGGSAVASQTVEDGQTATAPANPSRSGYTFGGWFTDAACTQAWSFSTAVTGNMTLYAGWEEELPPPPVTYSVSFNSQGGSAVSSQTVEEGKTATAPAAPSRSGYTFGGWYTDAACTQSWSFSTPITGNMTLYAKWTEVVVTPPSPSTPSVTTYTVSFNSQGGSNVSSQTVNSGAAASRPADPIKEGYTFEGWFTDTTFASEYNFSAAVTGNITLYAKWTTVFKITFVFKNSAVWDLDLDDLSDQILYTGADGRLTGSPQIPTIPGYTFTGWFSNSNCDMGFDSTKVFTQDETAYAQWQAETYEVTFDQNYSGAPQASEQTGYYYNDFITAKPDDPTREGYRFDGWYKEAKCTNAWDFDTDTVTGKMTLYAKWTAINTVTFDFNYTGGAAPTIQVESNSLITEEQKPATPTRENCTFIGWYKDEVCITPWNFATDKVTEDTRLFAKWYGAMETLKLSADSTADLAELKEMLKVCTVVIVEKTDSGSSVEGSVEIPEGKTLQVATGVTVNGSITANGTLIISGDVTDGVTIKETGNMTMDSGTIKAGKAAAALTVEGAEEAEDCVTLTGGTVDGEGKIAIQLNSGTISLGDGNGSGNVIADKPEKLLVGTVDGAGGINTVDAYTARPNEEKAGEYYLYSTYPYITNAIESAPDKSVIVVQNCRTPINETNTSAYPLQLTLDLNGKNVTVNGLQLKGTNNGNDVAIQLLITDTADGGSIDWKNWASSQGNLNKSSYIAATDSKYLPITESNTNYSYFPNLIGYPTVVADDFTSLGEAPTETEGT